MMKIPLGTNLLMVGFIALALSIFALQVSGQDATPEVVVEVSWERLAIPGSTTIRRTKIPDGWLLVTETGVSATTEVIHDPEHAWLKPEADPLPEHDEFSAYVAADKEMWEALHPHLMKYLQYIAKNPGKTQVMGLMQNWKLRIAMARR